jgi:hypothetical protein
VTRGVQRREKKNRAKISSASKKSSYLLTSLLLFFAAPVDFFWRLWKDFRDFLLSRFKPPLSRNAQTRNKKNRAKRPGEGGGKEGKKAAFVLVSADELVLGGKKVFFVFLNPPCYETPKNVITNKIKEE